MRLHFSLRARTHACNAHTLFNRTCEREKKSLHKVAQKRLVDLSPHCLSPSSLASSSASSFSLSLCSSSLSLCSTLSLVLRCTRIRPFPSAQLSRDSSFSSSLFFNISLSVPVSRAYRLAERRELAARRGPEPLRRRHQVHRPQRPSHPQHLPRGRVGKKCDPTRPGAKPRSRGFLGSRDRHVALTSFSVLSAPPLPLFPSVHPRGSLARAMGSGR